MGLRVGGGAAVGEVQVADAEHILQGLSPAHADFPAHDLCIPTLR